MVEKGVSEGRGQHQTGRTNGFSGPLSEDLSLSKTRLLFVAVCVYLASQVFTVPIAAIGPSWAVWPTLSDFAVAGILMGRMAAGRGNPIPRASADSCRWFAAVLAVSLLSYVVQVILLPGAIGMASDDTAVIFGGFSLYRTVQFLIVWWGVAPLAIDESRRIILKHLAFWVFLLVCAGVVGTGLGLIPPGDFAAHLPHDRSAGAWLYFMDVEGEGVGAIGYNHGYVAVQVMMLLALYLHLAAADGPHVVMTLLLTGLALFSCLLTGSRMGLISMLVFCPFVFATIPGRVRLNAIIIIGLIALMIAVAIPWGELGQNTGNPEGGDIYERQKTIFAAFKHESLSGRDDIWQDRIGRLNANPIRWVFGEGLGSTALLGGDAHMQLLQIVSELGLFGVLIWGMWFGSTARYLWEQECGSRAVFWVSICLLVSCTSQETLYPVAAMGHFLGLYVMTVAIALRSPIRETKENNHACISYQ